MAVTAGSVALSLVMLTAVLDAVRVTDAFGVQSDVVRAATAAVELEVEYPTVSRPGLASPLAITITRSGGFDEEVEVAISRAYFGLWDFNGVVPAPQEETADDETVRWTFAAPDGDVFSMQFDARIEPARQGGARGRVAVLEPDGSEAVAVEFTTNLRP